MKGNLYNRTHGENPLADKLLAMLDLERKDFGRYRDIYLTHWGARIVVYTRIGGASRAYFRKQTKKLGMHPLILNAWDDSFDPTYHYIEFRVGKGMLDQAARLFNEQGGDPETVQEKFEKTNAEMANMTPDQLMADPRFAETAKMMLELIKPGMPPVMRFYDEDMPKELQA